MTDYFAFPAKARYTFLRTELSDHQCLISVFFAVACQNCLITIEEKFMSVAETFSLCGRKIRCREALAEVFAKIQLTLSAMNRSGFTVQQRRQSAALTQCF